MNTNLSGRWHGAPPNGTRFSAATHMLAFDLHGVFFHRNKLQMVRHVPSLRPRWYVLCLLLNPLFWISFAYIRSMTEVSDHIFDYLSARFSGLHRLKADFIELENMQSLDDEMACLLAQFSQAGFSITLLSNIGERALLDLKLKNRAFFDLFDSFYIPQQSNGYVQKPELNFYDGFKSSIKPLDPKQVVFVDDKIANVKAAAQAGLIAYHFHTVEQFKRDFDLN